MPELAAVILEAARKEFDRIKRQAERAMQQLDDDEFFFRLGEDANSIYVIVKHLSGNMVSRWTDFLTTDGEKPDRHRDDEFVEQADVPRDAIMRLWNRGWECMFNELGALRGEDMVKTVHIRGEPHTVCHAITRQLSHHSYHVGQILTIARHVRGDRWRCLSIPRGQSEQYNREMGMPATPSR